MMTTKTAVLAATMIGCCGIVPIPAQQPSPSDGPQYTADGKLLFPANYREWIFLSSGIGMSYSPASSPNADPGFDNVFVSPTAYRAFQRTGTWPDKTVLVLEGRSSRSRGSINQGGHFQSDLDAVEAEVKDEARFTGKWAFFAFGGATAPGNQLPAKASCYSCHAKSGAVDNTFVQFYPTLLAIARQKGTLRAGALEPH